MANQISRGESKQSFLQSKTSHLCFRICIVGLLMLSLSISLVQTAICPSSVLFSSAIITDQCSFTGFSIAVTNGVVGGPVSNSLYYLHQLTSSSDYAVVRKVDVSGSQTWIASFAFWPIQKSLSVDAAEQSVYLASWVNPLVVLILSSSDGSVVSQHQL